MVRNAKKKPINTTKLYGHFAVITLAITAVVGLMADGEAKKVVKAELKEQRPAAAKIEGEAVSPVISRRPGPPANQSAASFGPAPEFGAPTSRTRGGSGQMPLNLGRSPSKVGQEAAVWTQLGMSEEEWFQLDPELRHQLTGGRNVLVSGTAAERQSAMDSLSRQSRARSGRPNIAGDLNPDTPGDF